MVLNFSEKIKEALSKGPLTSAELAKRMGYTPQYVSDLLLSKRRWNETTMSKACEALGLKLSLSNIIDEHNPALKQKIG